MGNLGLDSLHIHYCDFAYKRPGPFRMASTNISDVTAKTFAEYVWKTPCPGSQNPLWGAPPIRLKRLTYTE